MIMINKFVLFVTLMYICISNHYIMAQTYIYKGRYQNQSEIAFTWDGTYLYEGRFTNQQNILYTFDGKYIYKGRFTNLNDIVYKRYCLYGGW